MRTFSIQTLGCKVNQYESEQIASLLRGRGLLQVDPAEPADLRVVNTCSVTVQAASKSRQTVRRAVRLPVLAAPTRSTPAAPERGRVLVIGCWATSHPEQAAGLPGVSAVLTHHDDVAAKLHGIVSRWESEHRVGVLGTGSPESQPVRGEGLPVRGEGLSDSALAPAGPDNACNPISAADPVKKKITVGHGTVSLPQLDSRQTAHQRAFLKIQDGCDAHCTYCIIPKLRPRLWSKPIDRTVAEARALVEAGHKELVLTGIFLGAYGQPTALRRRQPRPTAEPLGQLLRALCDQVPGLRRVRLSSLEPGDLSAELVSLMKDMPQVVPHFHLPLQSGSDPLLRRMNRQYTRDDFLRMADLLRGAFDRPALTTDVIVGFPGESDAEFERTLELVDRVGFIHVHAFSFSPRPGTAAARWIGDFVRGPVVNERIDILRDRSAKHDFEFRKQFIGETSTLLVERNERSINDTSLRHGRCERYFPIHFEGDESLVGRMVRIQIDRVGLQRTWGTLQGVEEP